MRGQQGAAGMRGHADVRHHAREAGAGSRPVGTTLVAPPIKTCGGTSLAEELEGGRLGRPMPNTSSYRYAAHGSWWQRFRVQRQCNDVHRVLQGQG